MFVYYTVEKLSGILLISCLSIFNEQVNFSLFKMSFCTGVLLYRYIFTKERIAFVCEYDYIYNNHAAIFVWYLQYVFICNSFF